jgi:hypothetical protein
MAAIGKATIGVVFLSTPHRGTFPYLIWDEALPTTPPFTSYSVALLNDIFTGSPTLVKMENAFNSGVIDTLQVYTFFENKATSFVAIPNSKVSFDHTVNFFSFEIKTIHTVADYL